MSAFVQRALLLPAALLLLAGVPRAAQASCGDYVILTGQRAQRTTAMIELVAHPPLARMPASGRDQPFTPCRGPHCSGRPSAPSSPPPPAPIPWRGELPAVLMADDAASYPGRRSWAREDFSLPPQETLGGIFHPPRHSA